MSFTPTGGRNAPIPHSLNKDSEFYGKYGMLKDGYSYQGGPGMVAMGEGLVGTTRGAGNSGMVGGTESQIIFGKLPEQSESKSKETISDPVPEENAESPLDYTQLSTQAASANAGSDAYEKYFLNRQGSYALNDDKNVEQDFKDEYQNIFTEELKAKSPETLAAKKAEIELADKHAANIDDSFDLNLGNLRKGNAVNFS
jgi:hypothetical protein